ncbi:hypothetical protein KAU34_11945, partial [candidate division WOR-3 bacterium]|nr:hypothetical protein [candidate division WOR-3 bacterium]
TFVDSVGVYNGFEDYYGVTALDYNTSGELGDSVFISLESGKAEKLVVPRSDFGNVLTPATANVTQSAGASNAITASATPKGGIMVTGDSYNIEWQTMKEGTDDMPVYNYCVYNQADPAVAILSDIDAFIEDSSYFDEIRVSTTVDTIGDTVTTVTSRDSVFAFYWNGNFVSPLFDGIEYSGSIYTHFADSLYRFMEESLTVVSDTDTVRCDTFAYELVDYFVESIQVTDDPGVPYTDNLLISGTMNRWALRGGVTYEIRWRTVADSVTATVWDITNNVQVPFGETWGDNWSFGPISFSNPDINSQYLYSDNLSSRTYFYICGVKYYFNFFGSEAYPMNWSNHPVTDEVWKVYNSGEVVPTEGNNFTINSSPFTIGNIVLDNIRVVPNPYIVRNPWEVSRDYPVLIFTNLPSECTIRIYTLAGNLIQTIEHQVEASASSAIQGGSERWDVLTSNNQRPASGIYIYHIETPSGETKTGKFALIR